MLQPAERQCIFPGRGMLRAGTRATAGVVTGQERQVAGVELADQSARDDSTRRRRARMAHAILIVAGVSLVIGLADVVYEAVTAKGPWRARLVGGEPVEVRFLCGANAVVDCNVSVKVTYHRQDSRWCEQLDFSDHRVWSEKPSCNGDPEHNMISILGVVHDFDRFGAVRVHDHLVGQMFPG